MDNQLVSHEANEAVTLSMRVDPLSVTRVVQEGFAKRRVPTGEKTVGLKAFLTKLITGDLIRWS